MGGTAIGCEVVQRKNQYRIIITKENGGYEKLSYYHQYSCNNVIYIFNQYTVI